jgi:hypothetical protein
MRARLRTTGASIARSTVGKITATNSRNRRDAMLIALSEDCIRADASANLCKMVADSFQFGFRGDKGNYLRLTMT